MTAGSYEESLTNKNYIFRLKSYKKVNKFASEVDL